MPTNFRGVGALPVPEVRDSRPCRVHQFSLLEDERLACIPPSQQAHRNLAEEQSVTVMVYTRLGRSYGRLRAQKHAPSLRFAECSNR